MLIQEIMLGVALVKLYLELLRLFTKPVSGHYTKEVKRVSVTMTALVAISLTVAGVIYVRDGLADEQKADTNITLPPEGTHAASTEKKTFMERAERSYAVGDTNSHCAGPRDVSWRVEATEGWKIDIDTINFSPTTLSSKSVYKGVTDRTERGFSIKGRVVNRGNCVKLLGQLVSKDARGSLRVAGTYEEFRETTGT